jgi:hypothetical protein
MKILRVSALSCGLLLTLASCGSSKAVNTATPAAAPAPATAAPTTGAAAATTATASAATTAAPGAATTQPAATPAGPAAAVPAIYNFKTTKVGGGAVDGAEFAGKPVAFWFWAPT